MRRILVFIIALTTFQAFAGNSDRLGENGANELNMNGWARSTGLWDLNTARVMGVEAMRLNPAGLAQMGNMQVAFSQTLWFQGMDVQMTQGAMAARMGKNSIGFSLFSLNLGDFYRTTVSQPDPNNGLGTFKPNVLNLSVGFSRAFTDRIYAGTTLKLINEKTENVSAVGFAFDAGLQYLLGKKKQIRFGVSVRNLGTPMKYRGDGLTFLGNAPDPNGVDYQMTLSQNSNKFELPAQLTIGASYDLWLGSEFTRNGGYKMHRLTFVGSFISNTYGKDHFGGGVEYAFKEMFMFRAGYRYEDAIFNAEERTSAYTGFAGGVSVNVPFKENGPSMGIDYSYRTSDPWGGTHSIGLRFDLPYKEKEKDDMADDAFVKEKEVIVHDTIEVEKIVEVEKELADRDGDGLPDIYDICPDEKGEISAGGCKPVELTKEEEEEIKSIAAGINFETGSAELTADAKAEMDRLVEFMQDRKKAKVIIAAHTDNVGSESSNMALSDKRSNSARDYMISKGIDASRITAVAHGESKPIADNGTSTGRAKNRRVEVTIY